MLQNIQNALAEWKAVLIAAWTTATSGFTVAVILDAIELVGAVIAITFAGLINYAIWRKVKAEAQLLEIEVEKQQNRRKNDES